MTLPCWSPDFRRIAICSGIAVHICKAETGEEQPLFCMPESTSAAIHFLQRGKDTLVTDCKYAPPRYGTRGTVCGAWLS